MTGHSLEQGSPTLQSDGCVQSPVGLPVWTGLQDLGLYYFYLQRVPFEIESVGHHRSLHGLFGVEAQCWDLRGVVVA